MKTLSHSPKNLSSLIEPFGKKNYKKRIKENYQKWVDFQSQKNRKSKGLTDYANELLEGKLSPLYNLVFDYAGNKTFITKRKSEITEKIRKVTHAPNLEQQLREMLLQAYNDFRVAGAVRNSDLIIIEKFEQIKK